MINGENLVVSKLKRNRGIFLIFAIGIALFIWQLGSTGLVDETPPLFASAGRAMSETGDWLTPRVNGLPRYDKPPLVYWMMAFFYGLPGHQLWDPLGTWAARLPSAISSILMMCFLGDTVMRWPQPGDHYPRRTAIAVALAFGMSPLILLWGRTAVSDPLLCSTLGISLLFQWRQYVSSSSQTWFFSWFFLGLAVLVKGPVAIVLTVFVLFLFGLFERDFGYLLARLKPLRGFVVTSIIALPWYLLEVLVEGKAFLDSFFGYHNFQRFTSVVNSHLQPWWFFILIMILASLPFTPFLVLGIVQTSKTCLVGRKIDCFERKNSLMSFSFCWFISVFLFFTFSATKLPSYWLPAIPSASLLIGITASLSTQKNKILVSAWILTIMTLLAIATLFWSAPAWIPLINDPEMPGLADELLESNLPFSAAVFFTFATVLAILMNSFLNHPSLIPIQGTLLSFCLFTFLPLWSLGDRLRHLPVRQASELLLQSKRSGEEFAMVGVMKPSLHFYTSKIILYEGRSPQALVNLEDRLRNENRLNKTIVAIKKDNRIPSFLLVIDSNTAETSHWRNLEPQKLGSFGIYKVWRIDKNKLTKRANDLRRSGVYPDWQSPRPERY